jgi:hypothetical protein
MSYYNSFERFLAQTLSYLPGIKNLMKRIYQFLNYILYKKNFHFQSLYPMHQVSETTQENFFGYYDKSPENVSGNYTIYQRCKQSTTQKPSTNYPVQIVLKDINNNTDEIIGESCSYNWQQGTKLQWISPEKFIYNFFDNNSKTYKARIYDAFAKKEIAIIDKPIYDCFQDQYALTLNFQRLAKLRPDYGYRNSKEKIDFTDNTIDGIYKIDLKTNTTNFLFSINDVIEISLVSSMKNAKHKLNHIMISPDGENFMFMHRWLIPGGKRIDRLLISNKNGEKIKILVDEGMVSHCCWLNNKTIIGFFNYCTNKNSFYKIDIESCIIEPLSDKLTRFGDGHPTFHNSQMVFDSYPDRSRMKHLYIYDLIKDKVQEIGQFFEPLKYFGETRCDLHPKWNYTGDKIYIDSAHEGKRYLYEIKIEL